MAAVPNSDTPSQADTPMTDANEEHVTSVPVDAQMTVGPPPSPVVASHGIAALIACTQPP